MSGSRTGTALCLCVLSLMACQLSAAAREVRCSGVIFGERASIQGVVQLDYYDGDKFHATFRGQLTTERTVFRMAFEGYSVLGYEGFLQDDVGTILIKVLWGRTLNIYEARERLGAPKQYGEFACR